MENRQPAAVSIETYVCVVCQLVAAFIKPGEVTEEISKKGRLGLEREVKHRRKSTGVLVKKQAANN